MAWDRTPTSCGGCIVGVLILFLCYLSVVDRLSTTLVDEWLDSVRNDEIQWMLNATRHQWHKQEDVCTAFPHLRTRMAAQVSMKASHLLISALVYEPLDYLEIFVDNLLAFTRNSTVIMLHLSSSTNYTEAEVTTLVHRHPRVFINCHRYFTLAFHGSLAHAHLENIGWARQLGLDFHHVMLMPSNGWLIKLGVEDYVRKHQASLGNAFSVQFHRLHWEIPSEKIFKKRYSIGWDLQNVRTRLWCWEPMRTVISPGNKTSYLQTKHEGSFYPSHILLTLYDALKGINGSNTPGCPGDPNVWFSNTSGLQSMMQTELYLEEYVFSTWAMRHKENCMPADGVTVLAMHGGSHTTLERVNANQVKEAFRYSDVYGIKPIERHITDRGGAKAYIMGRLLEEQRMKTK